MALTQERLNYTENAASNIPFSTDKSPNFCCHSKCAPNLPPYSPSSTFPCSFGSISTIFLFICSHPFSTIKFIFFSIYFRKRHTRFLIFLFFSPSFRIHFFLFIRCVASCCPYPRPTLDLARKWFNLQ